MSKTPHLTIRLSDEDRERLKKLSRQAGDAPFAVVVRQLIRDAAKEAPRG